MSDTVVLDSGPLGLLTNPNNSPAPVAIRQWLADLLVASRRVILRDRRLRDPPRVHSGHDDSSFDPVGFPGNSDRISSDHYPRNAQSCRILGAGTKRRQTDCPRPRPRWRCHPRRASSVAWCTCDRRDREPRASGAFRADRRLGEYRSLMHVIRMLDAAHQFAILMPQIMLSNPW